MAPLPPVVLWEIQQQSRDSGWLCDARDAERQLSRPPRMDVTDRLGWARLPGDRYIHLHTSLLDLTLFAITLTYHRLPRRLLSTIYIHSYATNSANSPSCLSRPPRMPTFLLRAPWTKSTLYPRHLPDQQHQCRPVKKRSSQMPNANGMKAFSSLSCS